ncbi:TetR/AcrR family transcriptional regulator (plasmid) [Deinococcus metallilatus]|uniref:AcrR family transcriptional regulator n=1 Tax=Deinococcus metallilatus TaxID=1211322 RepID=A0AAJ5F6T9_9DEIO|nr:helix-turn-helix domain-containing protein [Deinococcus metallilatus]MBB5297305.1 AcrR family transcriptional regulator [Deinococcus metallilatus]QBY06949.1 TetR/AcrR family transcriptional regulator [Deinococcus metallilatus]TLK31896.1 helix-turn-helix transcriptional regulator [Deinococcus metallilatus]GMA17131.1 TetR family transcriptional regulator [Deinococcus metallilatus]
MTVSAPPKRLASPDRRAQILDAAEALFIERGFEGVAMPDLAARLGTSRPTIYSYFTSTGEMLAALLDARLAALWERIAPLLPHLASGTPQDFARLTRELLHERELLLLLHSGGGPIFRAHRCTFLQGLETRLGAALPPNAERHPHLLRLVILTLEAAALAALHGDLPASDELGAAVGAFVRGGLDVALARAQPPGEGKAES